MLRHIHTWFARWFTRWATRARRAYLQMLISSAEDDLKHIEAEIITLPALADMHRKHLEALRVEQASLRR